MFLGLCKKRCRPAACLFDMSGHSGSLQDPGLRWCRSRVALGELGRGRRVIMLSVWPATAAQHSRGLGRQRVPSTAPVPTCTWPPLGLWSRVAVLGVMVAGGPAVAVWPVTSEQLPPLLCVCHSPLSAYVPLGRTLRASLR